MHFKMSSAVCFNLNRSRILSSVNGLKYDSVAVIYIVKLRQWCHQNRPNDNFLFVELSTKKDPSKENLSTVQGPLFELENGENQDQTAEKYKPILGLQRKVYVKV